jgi:hypothetical protein
MKLTPFFVGLVAAALIGATGCGKKVADQAPPVRGGIEVAKLTAAFKDAPEDLRTPVDQVLLNLRYHQYPDAIAKLDGLTSDARVTDAQKGVITNTIEQIKQKMEEPAAAPAQ